MSDQMTDLRANSQGFEVEKYPILDVGCWPEALDELNRPTVGHLNPTQRFPVAEIEGCFPVAGLA